MMEVIVDVAILCGEDACVYGTVRRTWNTELMPMVGMELEDAAWKEPREIQRVVISPGEGYYLLYVGDDTMPDRVACSERVEMYTLHEWKRLG